MSGILLCADLHLGATHHDGVGLDGSPSWRQQEAQRVVDFIVDTADERGARIVVAGDLYHSVRPQAWAYRAAGVLCLNDKVHGETVVIPGNHDWPVSEGVLSPLFVSGNPFDKPAMLRLDDLDLMLIPWFSRAFVAATYPDLLVGEQNRFMASALERIVADLCSRKREGVPLIVVTHFSIGGATYCNDTQPQIGESSDFMVPASVFDDPRIEAVFAGHIHKPQTFGKITYVGSPVRSDFGEKSQPTRILHITNANGQVRVEELLTPSVEFVDVDLSGNDCPGVIGKVVRIVGEAPAGEETAARIAHLTEVLYAASALHVSKPAVKFTRHEARAVRLIEVDATPEAALATYAEMVGGSYLENLDALLSLQSDLERSAIA